MPEWLPTVILGVSVTVPAMLTAVFSYYKNRGSLAETYEGIAKRKTKELVECEANCKNLRYEKEMLEVENRRLNRLLACKETE